MLLKCEDKTTNMQSFTHFSRHALVRVAQRTSLSCEEIAEILDRDLVVTIGIKPRLNRKHILFYSISDEDYFVALQDVVTGTVVTILPLEYHENLAWKISDIDCEKAKEILLAAPPLVKPDPSKLSKKFIISAHFHDGNGQQKTQVILKESCDLYQNNLMKFLAEKSIFLQIDKLAAVKGIPVDKMFSISVKQGKNGTPVVIDLSIV